MGAAENKTFNSMKQKNLLWLVAVALLLPLFALTACSDDDDDDNANTEQTSTNGTTTLSKKVTKIVCTCTYYSEEGESEAEETYLFDTDGKIISMLRDEGKDTFLYTYTYTSNQIIVAESGTFVGCIYYNLENGRITESVYEYKDSKDTYKYTYSSDGYLASVIEGRAEETASPYTTIYTVSDGNYSMIKTTWDDEGITQSITYSSNLNNLNVDLAQILIWGTPYYLGNKIKNLPSSINEVDNYDEWKYNSNSSFYYTYEGNYLTKIVKNEVENQTNGEYIRNSSNTYTYEIFYE